MTLICKSCGEDDQALFSAKDIARATRGRPKCKPCKTEYARKRYQKVQAKHEDEATPLIVRLAKQFPAPTTNLHRQGSVHTIQT